MTRFYFPNSLFACCAILLLATNGWSQNIVFIPVPQAYSLTKHPTLPVLYVGCSFMPESKNLVTFRLDAQGKLIADSRREWPDWFSSDPKNGDFIYTLWRPTLWPEKGILYLGASIGYRDKFFAATNSYEFAAIALDAEGLPTKPLRLFRTQLSGKDNVMGIRCDPDLRRLCISYYYQFGWCDLDERGVPQPASYQLASAVGSLWEWIWVARWQRYFTTPGGMGLSAYQLDGSRTAQFSQQIFTTDDKNGGNVPRYNLEFSERHRKLYLLRSPPGKELMVMQLTNEGHFTGVPRYFPIGPASAIRFDFKTGLLYAFSSEWMKVFTLDADGCPTGTPTVREFKCGDLRDVIVDGTTRTAYIACTQPPTEK